MSYTTIATKPNMPLGSRKVVKVDDNDVLLVNVNDEFYAVGLFCPHNPKFSLAEAPIEGNIVTCSEDGSQFDLRTGKNTLGPKGLFGRKAVKNLRTYTIKLEGEAIRVQSL